jgi:hypothetical protein
MGRLLERRVEVCLSSIDTIQAQASPKLDFYTHTHTHTLTLLSLLIHGILLFCVLPVPQWLIDAMPAPLL